MVSKGENKIYTNDYYTFWPFVNIYNDKNKGGTSTELDSIIIMVLATESEHMGSFMNRQFK